MTEMDSGITNILPQPSALMMSCDVKQPASSPSLCVNQDKDGGHHDNMKLEDKAQPVKKGRPKGKLERSKAVCEDTSTPAPENCTKDQKLSSSGCYDDESTSCTKEALEKSQTPNKNVLIKESSVEYTDSSGVDLQQFISDTLNSNPRDRIALLKLERDMIDFITSNSPFKKFPQMSSYHRMLVHRVAAYFGMEHNVDQTGKAIIINRTVGTRIPEQRFLQQIREEKKEEIQQWKAILPRDTSSEDPLVLQPLREKQSRSMEERQEEYYRARERIFKQELHCVPDGSHDEPRALDDLNPFAETQRRRQIFRRSHGGSTSSWNSSGQQSSTESDYMYGSDPRPWSSTESDSSYQWKTAAPKPRHPGGHGPDARGTGSISLYRVQSPSIPEESPPAVNPPVYSVENAIPPGSILVNPQTGQPFLNPDGTPAVYIPPDSQQPIRSQPQLPAPPLQQPQPQMVQYSSVSYAAPSQPYSTQMEDLSSQFAHVAASCPSTGEAPPLYPPTQSYVYAAPPPLPSNQAPNYCQSSAQVPMYYYSGQYPTSTQQTCTTPSPNQHLLNQAGYPMTLAVQPSHSQAQSMLGNYPSMAAHQCGGGQAQGSVSYSQSGIVAPLGGEGGYCCMGPPPCATLAQPTHPGCFSMGGPAWGVQY
ncbi:cAMP-regulated phosphoprotein 21 isoform X1 [Gadus morhua]|uniref:cAMP-regulated phosphoprotein 21 isoform X1 n=1 Tax=Gadus morhua TaxID=8049 RepID=UPI0011B5464C|nr:cAMP-regulated phosphoprotein 21 isoform X1 [Gadus morhua]XP_030202379.1 cAMP-regulated phosphoprotein 21 isoform X1 [Gadus morhua]XP_030202380.1 cAMP-regulated phosphoprotein 21 isoform X1 [Gadus morhua]XP_030202381.1 cAMP-regulated phosphoprotein 21 isoform X1 [Gadus morhua]